MIATAGLFLELAKGAPCDTSRLQEPQPPPAFPVFDTEVLRSNAVHLSFMVRSKLLQQGADLQAVPIHIRADKFFVRLREEQFHRNPVSLLPVLTGIER